MATMRAWGAATTVFMAVLLPSWPAAPQAPAPFAVVLALTSRPVVELGPDGGSGPYQGPYSIGWEGVAWKLSGIHLLVPKTVELPSCPTVEPQRFGVWDTEGEVVWSASRYLCVPFCNPDLSGRFGRPDGVVGGPDLGAFIRALEMQDLRADCDGDGMVGLGPDLGPFISTFGLPVVVQ